MLNYEEIFQNRGNLYHRSMQQHPQARDREFTQATELVDFQEGDRVADIPAGGGYLKRYLPNNVVYLPHEPCENFVNHAVTETNNVSLLPLPFEDESVNVIFSIAGIHHLTDKVPLFKEMHRAAANNATLVVSDVKAGSNISIFLDQFVGKYNITGHEGLYIDESTQTDLQNSGWLVEHVEEMKYHWVFNNKQEMAEFCMMLFGLQNIAVEDVISEIDATLGSEQLADNRVGMNWALLTIKARKA